VQVEAPIRAIFPALRVQALDWVGHLSMFKVQTLKDWRGAKTAVSEFPDHLKRVEPMPLSVDMNQQVLQVLENKAPRKACRKKVPVGFG